VSLFPNLNLKNLNDDSKIITIYEDMYDKKYCIDCKKYTIASIYNYRWVNLGRYSMLSTNWSYLFVNIL
jgi:hypothetical protein